MWSRWEEIDRLLDSALDRPSRERQSFLEAKCEEDSALLTSVLDLLAIAESADDRLDVPDPGALAGLHRRARRW